MKFYNIFLKESEKGVIKDLVLIKDGFNFFTFLFSIFWFLYKRCYITFFILLVVNYIIFTSFSLSNFFIIYISLFLILGFESNRILIKKYIIKDYKYLGYTSGKNEVEAKRRFLDSINSEEKEK